MPENPDTNASIVANDLTVNGLNVHYLRAGHGDPIVLLHGYPENSRTWRKLMPLLADAYTLIAPDTRGTGETSIAQSFSIEEAAEDVYQLVRKLGFSRVVLFAQDFGVQVAGAFAARHREDVRGLIVAESPLLGFGLEDLYADFWHFKFFASPFAAMLIQNNIEPFFRNFAFGDFVHDKDAFTDDDIAAYVEAQRRPGRLDAGLAYYRALQSEAEFFRTSVPPAWAFPVLALDGEYAMNGASAQSFRRVASDVTGRIVPGSGHFVQEERPDFVAREVRAFMQSL